MTDYYKWLRPNRMPMHGAGQWPEPGQWLRVKRTLVPCKHGLHLCREQDLAHWIAPELWIVEPRDGTETIVCDDKIVVREARLVRRVEEWNEITARHFACDCATYALDLVHARGCALDYDSCRGVVDLVRIKALGGNVPDEELTAARAAAWAATWAATWAAAQAATWAAARAADQAAARNAWAAARNAAWDADQAATWADQDAVRDAQAQQLLYYVRKV